MSKISQPADRNPGKNPQVEPASEYMNRTSVDRLPLRKMHTTDGNYEQEDRDRNLLKLIQEQLEIARRAYEDRMRAVLKESSMYIYI